MNSLRHTRITLKDVAKACGYTANTVSRAMRNDEKLPLVTREKIQAIAMDMGYIPNSLASTLRSGASKTVAVIVNDLRNQHFSIVLSKIDAALRACGYTMMVLCMQLDENLADQLIQIAISKSVDGVLFFPYYDNRRHIDHLLKNNMPFVLLDRRIKGVAADSVRCDDEQGGYLAGCHLASLGHTQFLFLAGVLTSSSQVDRYRGFMRALREARIPSENVRMVPWQAIDAAIQKGSIASLLEPIDYTGVVSFSDEIAYHALNAYTDLGVRVPDDVSIISFDCIRSGFPYLPPLTSIYSTEGNVGETGVQILFKRLSDHELHVQQAVFSVSIMDGGTTAPCNTNPNP